MLEGEERFGWLPACSAPPIRTPYDAERDACFYQPPEPGHDPAPRYLTLTPGFFVVFLPGDVHTPGLCPAGSAPLPVVKAVVKVPLCT